MNDEAKIRRAMRALADLEKAASIADAARSDEFQYVQRFSAKASDSKGLNPPFTWNNLVKLSELMDDFERYDRCGRQYSALRKQS